MESSEIEIPITYAEIIEKLLNRLKMKVFFLMTKETAIPQDIEYCLKLTIIATNAWDAVKQIEHDEKTERKDHSNLKNDLEVTLRMLESYTNDTESIE